MLAVRRAKLRSALLLGRLFSAQTGRAEFAERAAPVFAAHGESFEGLGDKAKVVSELEQLFGFNVPNAQLGRMTSADVAVDFFYDAAMSVHKQQEEYDTFVEDIPSNLKWSPAKDTFDSFRSS